MMGLMELKERVLGFPDRKDTRPPCSKQAKMQESEVPNRGGVSSVVQALQPPEPGENLRISYETCKQAAIFPGTDRPAGLLQINEPTAQSSLALDVNWYPTECKNCGQAFTASWPSCISLTGGSIWKCPKCNVSHGATIEALTELVNGDFDEEYLYPRNGDWRFTQPVQRSTLDKVNAIRELALSLGWHEARLYQNRGQLRFPCGDDWGLVCHIFEQAGTIKDGIAVRKRLIGEVTRQNIEILCDNIGIRVHRDINDQVCYTRHLQGVNTSLFFNNPDLDQPWAKRVKNT